MLRVAVVSGLLLLTLSDEAAQASEEVADAADAVPSRFDYHSVRGRQPRKASSGRFEGELQLEMIGKSRVQSMKHYGDQWSGDAHLLWDGSVGESMQTSFDLPADGLFDIAFQLTVAVDYGVFEVSLNGETILDSVDLYGPDVALARLLTVQKLRLQAGRQTLVFKLIGKNPGAKTFHGGYLLGLDYLQLTQLDKPESPIKAEKSGRAAASDKTRKDSDVKPMTMTALTTTMQQFCFQCHSDDVMEGKVDLSQFTDRTTFLNDIQTTRRIRDAVHRREMPPKDEEQLNDVQRTRWVATLDSLIDEYLKHHHSDAPVVMRRMNRYEYNNAVRDLLQLQGDIYPLPEKTIRSSQSYFDPASGSFPDVIQVGNRTLGKNQVERQILTGVSPFAIDLQAEGGFNNRGRELSVSPLLLESFLRLGHSIVNSPEFDGYCGLTSTLFTVPPDSTLENQQQLARERLAGFLERAFRGKIEESVLNRYYEFFVAQLHETGSFRHSMKLVVAAVLASPRFIYLSESPADIAHKNGKNQPQALNPYELATRLSFLLWSSIPDEPLLRVARNGTLLQPEVLDLQVARMLEDPRSQALSQNFARQWLRLDRLITAVPDFDRFPQYYARIGCEQWKFGLQTMIEPLLLFESIMVEDRSIMLLIDCNYAYRSDELQSWYQDEVPFADRKNRNRFNTGQQQFRRRHLQDRRQGGIMTSAATLTMTSAPLRTSPIARGAWVATVIFNQPPPPPPDVVPPIEEDDKAIEAQGLTLRQRLVQHQVNQSCVACHSKIDPLGFALENFDAIGRWRNTYSSGLAIDASGKLFGKTPFNDVTGLKDAILQEPEWFMRAFCEHLLSYAVGRELELSDTPAIDNIVSQVAADHGQFTTVVRAIVHSHPFRYRAQTSPRTAMNKSPSQAENGRAEGQGIRR